MEAGGSKKQSKQNPLSFYNYMANGVNSESEEEEETVDQANDDENPFSFKAFCPDPKLPSIPKKVTTARSKEPKKGVDPDPKSSSDSLKSDTSSTPPFPSSPPPRPVLRNGADDVHLNAAPEPVDCHNCRRLAKENKRLRAQLQESVDSSAQLQKRVSKLSGQLKAREERESKEASQLEQMLHQVERNLHQSTKRADEAERNVGRLKREVNQLRAQLQSGDSQQRSQAIGAELTESSLAAKQMLKELLKGVNRLSVIGESLQMDAKFSEE